MTLPKSKWKFNKVCLSDLNSVNGGHKITNGLLKSLFNSSDIFLLTFLEIK